MFLFCWDPSRNPGPLGRVPGEYCPFRSHSVSVDVTHSSQPEVVSICATAVLSLKHTLWASLQNPSARDGVRRAMGEGNLLSDQKSQEPSKELKQDLGSRLKSHKSSPLPILKPSS